ncbi:tetratricopeptide repeat-containing sulfotransferase family protein [Litorisediminicola beolgyonensis]|uniref:Tetratricopeptide repeat-containing sulfotransferase family protein n=1 Tax=Litorisediminicola beolgyonensis TaxID=1173614 RepID=A0ABW3ZCU5_9RHOB
MIPPKPQMPPFKSRYAAALAALQAGRVGAAQSAFRELLRERPDVPEIHFQLSRIAHHAGDRAARAAHLRRALDLKPDEPALNEAAADAFAALGERDAALAAHDRLIAAEPGSIKRRVDKGMYLQLSGEFDAADALFRDLIKRHPDEGALYRIMLATTRLTADDPLMAQLETLLKRPNLPDQSRFHAHFAMAKALEDQERYAEVFPHLDRANALQRKLSPYDAAARVAEQGQFRAAQEGADLTPIALDAAIRPVFVIGMPRSGTTLVERILGAHSAVSAGGELGHALKLATKFFSANNRLIPLKSVSDAQLRDYARAYLGLVRRDTGAQAGVVTDKSIQTHLVLGYIAKAMPEARVVFVHRDPRDVALSIYKNHFALGTHRYGNDLADIAEAIRLFRDQARYWSVRLGPRATSVQYEALVADPEPEAERLVAFCDLPWEEACLSPHQSGGQVKTLSLAQVRQPIHGGRAAAWRRYEAALQPFIEAWGDTSWD